MSVYDYHNSLLQSYKQSVSVKGNGTTIVLNVNVPILDFSAVFFDIKFKTNNSVFKETYILFVKDEEGFCDRNIVIKQYEKIIEMNKVE